MKERTYTKSEIFAILDNEIKKEIENKNKYINLNGYSHKDTLARFDYHIAALTGLYSKFEK